MIPQREYISIVIAIICIGVIIAFVATNVISFSDISSAIAYVLIGGIIAILGWGFKPRIIGAPVNKELDRKTHFDNESKKKTKELARVEPKKIQHKTVKLRIDEYEDQKLNLKRGTKITGKISSDGFFNTYFITESSYRSFKNELGFQHLEGAENVSYFEPNFEVQRNGNYYFVIEHADKKNIVVNVELYAN